MHYRNQTARNGYRKVRQYDEWCTYHSYYNVVWLCYKYRVAECATFHRLVFITYSLALRRKWSYDKSFAQLENCIFNFDLFYFVGITIKKVRNKLFTNHVAVHHAFSAPYFCGK